MVEHYQARKSTVLFCGKKLAEHLSKDKVGHQHIKAKLECLISYSPSVSDFSSLYYDAVRALYDIKESSQAFLQLVNLAEKLPNDTSYLDICFSHTDYLEANNKYEESIEVYTSMLDKEPNVNYEQSIRGYRAECYLRTEEYDKALADLKLVETLKKGKETTRTLNFLLHAVYLNFHLGNYEEAKRIILVISGASEKARNEMNHAQAAKNLSNLIKENSLDTWLTKSEQWWEKWLGMRDKFRHDVSTYNDHVPIELSNLRLSKDALNAFNKSLSFSRWQPTATLLLYKEVDAVAKLNPSLAKDLYKLCDEILTVPENVNSVNKSSYLLHRFIFLRVTNEYDKMKSLAVNFFKKSTLDDVVSQAIFRLWAFEAAEQEQDLEYLIQKAKSILESKEIETLYDRPIFIYALSNLYKAQGKKSEELTLLLAEEANNKALPKNQYAKLCLSRLTELKESFGKAKNYSLALDKIWENYEPKWFKYVKSPKSFADLNKALEEQDSLSDVEKLKLHYLVIKDEEMDADKRYTSFKALIVDLYFSELSVAAKKRFVRNLVTIKELSQELKTYLLWEDLYTHYKRRSFNDLTFTASSPYFKGNQFQQQWVKETAAYLYAREQSIDELEVYIKKLFKEDLTDLRYTLLQDSLKDLAHRGELERVLKLCKEEVKSVQVQEGLKLTRLSVKLGIKRLSKKLKAEVPRYLKSKSYVQGILDKVQKVELKDSFVFEFNYGLFLDNKSLLEQDIYSIKTSTLNSDNVQSFLNLAFKYKGKGIDRSTRVKMLRELLLEAENDNKLSNVIFSLFKADPTFTLKDKERLISLIKPYQKDSFKTSFDLISILDLDYKTAQGESVDFDQDYTDMKGSFLTPYFTAAKLNHFLRNNQKAELEEFVSSMTEEQLLNWNNFALIRKALISLDMEDELELIQEEQDGLLLSKILDAWKNHELHNLSKALEISFYIGKLDEPILKEVVSDFLTFVKDKKSNDSLKVTMSLLNKDWQKVIEITDSDENEIAGWFKGYAAYQLKDYSLAEQALEAFIASKNTDVLALDAIELLAKVKRLKSSKED